MALINCPQCGKKISDKAESCPHCGFNNEGTVIVDNQSNTSAVIDSKNVADDGIEEKTLVSAENQGDDSSTDASSGQVDEKTSYSENIDGEDTSKETLKEEEHYPENKESSTELDVQYKSKANDKQFGINFRSKKQLQGEIVPISKEAQVEKDASEVTPEKDEEETSCSKSNDIESDSTVTEEEQQLEKGVSSTNSDSQDNKVFKDEQNTVNVRSNEQGQNEITPNPIGGQVNDASMDLSSRRVDDIINHSDNRDNQDVDVDAGKIEDEQQPEKSVSSVDSDSQDKSIDKDDQSNTNEPVNLPSSNTKEEYYTDNNPIKGSKKGSPLIVLLISIIIVMGVICALLFGHMNKSSEEPKQAVSKSEENSADAIQDSLSLDNNNVNPNSDSEVEEEPTQTVEAESRPDEENNNTSNEASDTLSDAKDNGKVIVDQDGCYVEYRGVEESDLDEYIISLYLENNTENEVYFVFAETMINGFSVQVYNSYIQMPVGAKNLTIPNYEMVVKKSELNAYGIKEIERFESNLQVMSADLSETLWEKQVEVVVKENGDTNSQDGNSNNIKGNGAVLVDQDGYYVEYRSVENYSSDEYIINMYLENNTDEELYFVFEDTRINGFNVQIYNSYLQLPSKAKNLTVPNYEMVIKKEELQAYDIEKVEDIKCKFQVMPVDLSTTTWETELEITV